MTLKISSLEPVVTFCFMILKPFRKIQLTDSLFSATVTSHSWSGFGLIYFRENDAPADGIYLLAGKDAPNWHKTDNQNAARVLKKVEPVYIFNNVRKMYLGEIRERLAIPLRLLI